MQYIESVQLEERVSNMEQEHDENLSVNSVEAAVWNEEQKRLYVFSSPYLSFVKLFELENDRLVFKKEHKMNTKWDYRFEDATFVGRKLFLLSPSLNCNVDNPIIWQADVKSFKQISVVDTENFLTAQEANDTFICGTENELLVAIDRTVRVLQKKKWVNQFKLKNYPFSTMIFSNNILFVSYEKQLVGYQWNSNKLQIEEIVWGPLRTSYRGTLRTQFAISPKGTLIIADTINPRNWLLFDTNKTSQNPEPFDTKVWPIERRWGLNSVSPIAMCSERFVVTNSEHTIVDLTKSHSKLVDAYIESACWCPKRERIYYISVLASRSWPPRHHDFILTRAKVCGEDLYVEAEVRWENNSTDVDIVIAGGKLFILCSKERGPYRVYNRDAPAARLWEADFDTLKPIGQLDIRKLTDPFIRADRIDRADSSINTPSKEVSQPLTKSEDDENAEKLRENDRETTDTEEDKLNQEKSEVSTNTSRREDISEDEDRTEKLQKLEAEWIEEKIQEQLTYKLSGNKTHLILIVSTPEESKGSVNSLDVRGVRQFDETESYITSYKSKDGKLHCFTTLATKDMPSQTLWVRMTENIVYICSGIHSYTQCTNSIIGYSWDSECVSLTNIVWGPTKNLSTSCVESYFKHFKGVITPNGTLVTTTIEKCTEGHFKDLECQNPWTLYKGDQKSEKWVVVLTSKNQYERNINYPLVAISEDLFIAQYGLVKLEAKPRKHKCRG